MTDSDNLTCVAETRVKNDIANRLLQILYPKDK